MPVIVEEDCRSLMLVKEEVLKSVVQAPVAGCATHVGNGDCGPQGAIFRTPQASATLLYGRSQATSKFPNQRYNAVSFTGILTPYEVVPRTFHVDEVAPGFCDLLECAQYYFKILHRW